MLESGSSTAFRRIAVIAAALSLALVACGGGDDSGSDAENSRSGTTLTQVSPLTGLDAPDGFPDHPVIVVKIDNTSSAEPQLGLRDAAAEADELTGVVREGDRRRREDARRAAPVAPAPNGDDAVSDLLGDGRRRRDPGRPHAAREPQAIRHRRRAEDVRAGGRDRAEAGERSNRPRVCDGRHQR